MHAALDILALVAIAGIVAGFARRMGWSEPLVLTVVGIGISFIPNVLEIQLTPDLVLIGLLPPLLYAAAIRTSLVDFKANRRAIGLLSVGLVAFSTVAVGLVSWWAMPGISLAAGFALGAVVAPPDAVAATTVARRVGMPRRIVSILEGESLVNDATALVALNTAIAALTATVSPWQVGWEFVRAAGGGVLVGLVVAFVLAKIRKRIDDPVLDTTLSFAAPYVAFLPAEEIHASGVLAVVVTGLILGHKAPVLQTASSRIAENINWRTVQFLLENVVFLLIGLQMRRLLSSVVDEHLPWTQIVWPCLAVLAATILARGVWMLAVVSTLKLLGRTAWDWRVSLVVSWAGHARCRHAGRGVPAAGRDARARAAGAGRVHRRGRHAADPGPDAAVAGAPARPARPGRGRGRAAERRAGHRRGPGRAGRAGRGRDRGRPAGGARATARAGHAPQQPHLGAAGPLAVRARAAGGRPTAGCGCRCSRPSAGRSSRPATGASTTTRCCARPCRRSTWRSRCSTASRTPPPASTTSSSRPRSAPATASTCRTRPRSSRPARRRAARSACATARGGCTCGCA